MLPFLGNYTEYRTRHQQIVTSNGKDAVVKVQLVKEKPAAKAVSKSNGKKGKIKVRSVEDVERDVERAEARVKELEDALSQAALEANAEQLTSLTAEYEQVKAHVDELLAEWEELSDMVG
jgi:ATP-binding cassette subfamily F protein 3